MNFRQRLWNCLTCCCLLSGTVLNGTGTALADEPTLQYPIDVAAAADGTVYIADLKLPGIWKYAEGKLSVHHQASRQFRTPLNAVRCVVVNAEGVLFAGDSSTREVYRLEAADKPVPLTGGKIGVASDLAIRGDQVLVSDLETQRIWSIPQAGGEPVELALLAGVRGLVVTPEQELIVVTTNADQVRMISSDGQQKILAAGRPFEFPHQAALVAGQLYVTDNYAQAIWKMPVAGGEAPQKFLGAAPLNKPVGICAKGETLLVADPHAKEVLVVSVDGKIQSLFGAAAE